MEYLHPAGGVVGGRHSPRAEPRDESRSPANRVFDSAKPVKQQIEADMVAQGRIRRFETVPHRELLTGPRKRAGFALRPGRFPASGLGGGNDGDSGAKRGSGLAAALSVCVGPIGLRREPRAFASPSRPNLSNSLTLSVSARADLTRGCDRGWNGIGTDPKPRAGWSACLI